MSVTEQHRPIGHEDDDVVFTLTLADILAFLKRSRRAMLIGALIGGLLGALYAFNKPNEYTSQVTLLPEIQAKSGGNMGGLSSLAGLAGIDINSLGGNADAVRPELYPTVLQSVPFALAVAKQPVYSKEFKKTQSLEAYLEAKNEPSWFSRLLSSSADSTAGLSFGPNTGALRLTKQQDELTKTILARVTGAYDKKSGVLTISATMPDPVVAAATTQQTLAYLTDYVTGYRTEKARMEVDFLTKQVAAAKQRYQQAEYALSAYRDQNRSVYLNTAKIEEQRIQAEFILAQDLYNALSKQSEMAKIKVQQDTPVFKILEPAQIPLKKSAPKRTVIILIATILGLFVGLIVVGLRTFRSV
ncbi:GNVR domain-containing protein [Fibrella aquatilis]|uniref:Lipopolysaccharide biosynthesis protein n=1 Tax=Fibrella aquatilis TaxID=2817059 RepID=A0A939K079_9BACT|nr:GNVR domain-containing protein [Fibrella aquatilis]MBO0930955.1 lipopolysaccharide biosynthesis protein [Fibrella aquatilis]